ncbi:MAG: outer membrane beta-barrel protein, partial [Flavobacteriaceae bacterium]|nr:outer membrane beta-barrel protein [Flavobacteriaceae bacterium]
DGGRKVIPIWWKIVGVAAGLALLVTLGNFIFNSPEIGVEVPTEIVDTEDVGEDAINENGVTEPQDSDENKDLINEDILNNNLVPQNNTVTDSDSGTESIDEPDNDLNLEDVLDPSNKLKGSQTQKTIVQSDQKNPQEKILDKKADVAQQEAPLNKSRSEETDNAIEQKINNAVAVDNVPQKLPELPTVDEASEGKKEGKAIEQGNAEGKIAVADKAIEKLKEKENKETTDVAEPSIEEALAATEDAEEMNEKEEEVINRWGVSASVSPVYYNTLGNGSSIHNNFNNNSKTGQLNMAYGVKASYDISDRLSVRTGINKVDVGYNTNDVIIYQSLAPSAGTIPQASPNNTMRNIDLKEPYQGITVLSGETLAFGQVPSVVAQNIKSSLDQEVSYIEVPVELEYRISEKKVGLSLIGGFSAMILNDNEVYTELNDERTLLGEAKNINELSYSANLGIGLGVRITEKTSLNFEPTFKYHLNAFNDTTGNFRPFMIGVTSGLKIKF